MTWASGAWLSSAWAADTFAGVVSSDSDIPVALAGVVLAAANFTGQVQPTQQVVAPATSTFSSGASLGLSTRLQGNPASSISINADLCEGQPTLSELATAMTVAGQLTGRQSLVAPLNVGLTASGQAQTSVRLAASSAFSKAWAVDLTSATRFDASAQGGLGIVPNLYFAWPVSGQTTLGGSFSGQPQINLSARGVSASTMAIAMEWRMDQGLAGGSNTAIAMSLAPTVGRGFEGYGLASLSLDPGIGWAKSFSAASGQTLSMAGSLLTSEKVTGSQAASLNLVGWLGQGGSIKGATHSLLRTHWATLPPIQAKEYLLSGGGQYELAKAQPLQVKAPARLLYAVNLRTFDVIRKVPTSLVCTSSARAWVFDTTNSEYTFEGASDESFGT